MFMISGETAISSWAASRGRVPSSLRSPAAAVERAARPRWSGAPAAADGGNAGPGTAGCPIPTNGTTIIRIHHHRLINSISTSPGPRASSPQLCIQLELGVLQFLIPVLCPTVFWMDLEKTSSKRIHFSSYCNYYLHANICLAFFMCTIIYSYDTRSAIHAKVWRVPIK